jgi:cytochrome bd-type quinol oxidase subunit 2
MLTLAKGGVKVTLDICYMANSTLFPAIFAGTAFGFCNAGAKIATILSPMLAELEPPTPMIIFVVMSTISAAVCWFIISEEDQLKKTKRLQSSKKILQ